MRKSRSLSLLIFVVILGIGVALAYGMHSMANKFLGIGIIGSAFVLALFVSSAVQVADQWSRAVVLRQGSSALSRGLEYF